MPLEGELQLHPIVGENILLTLPSHPRPLQEPTAPLYSQIRPSRDRRRAWSRECPPRLWRGQGSPQCSSQRNHPPSPRRCCRCVPRYNQTSHLHNCHLISSPSLFQPVMFHSGTIALSLLGGPLIVLRTTPSHPRSSRGRIHRSHPPRGIHPGLNRRRPSSSLCGSSWGDGWTSSTFQSRRRRRRSRRGVSRCPRPRSRHALLCCVW